MTYEYNADARAEAAKHPVSSVGLDEIARRCAALRYQHGPDAPASHEINYSTDTWNGLLDALPPTARDGHVTRRDVFEVAQAVSLDERPVRDLFSASYIWGQGLTGYGRSRYNQIVEANPDLDTRLDKAIRTAHGDPIDAYAQLFGGYTHDGGDARAAAGDARWSRIAHYGPAFFTKLLYFTGGRALILDAVLAGRVHELSGLSKLVDEQGRPRAWSPYRYDVYLHWMEQTSSAVTAADPSVSATPSLVELALFSSRPPQAGESDAAD